MTKPYQCAGCLVHSVAKKSELCTACRRRERYAKDPEYAEARRRESREYLARKDAERPTHFTPPT